MSQEYTFTPVYGTGVTVAPSTSSASSTLGKGQKQYVVTNTGSVVCYVRAGVGSATATAADYPVLPNTQVAITKDRGADTIAYLAASGSGALHIIPGEGF